MSICIGPSLFAYVLSHVARNMIKAKQSLKLLNIGEHINFIFKCNFSKYFPHQTLLELNLGLILP